MTDIQATKRGSDARGHSSPAPAVTRAAAVLDALAASDRSELQQALDQLAPEFRETLVLLELQDLSYKEIARVTGAPIGTVMSRLARARRHLQQALGLGAGEKS